MPHCMQEGHACNKPVAQTVYIPWFVASYDTHKGKCWLNSNPPNHRGIIRWCGTGGFQEQGPCFFIGRSCSISTIVLYYFSFSLLPVYRLVLWGWGLWADRVYITLSQPCTVGPSQLALNNITVCTQQCIYIQHIKKLQCSFNITACYSYNATQAKLHVTAKCNAIAVEKTHRISCSRRETSQQTIIKSSLTMRRTTNPLNSQVYPRYFNN